MSFRRCAISLLVASLGVWFVTARAQGGGAGPVRVCVGGDGVLHAPATGQSCPAGQRSLALAGPRAGGPGPATPGQPGQKPDPAYEAVLDLHRRVSALEARPVFEVVDQNDRPIFTVGAGLARLYNSSGGVVATINATAAGGFFTGRTPTGLLAASVGASGSRGGVLMSEKGVPRIDLGKQEGGNFSLRFPAPGGGVVAGIGESRAGTGAISVAEIGGWLKALLSVADDKGTASVLNGAATLISMTEGATAGGLLSIGDAQSEPMVRMGVTKDRYGIVLTGPAAGLPLVPATGLPGSYIIGSVGKWVELRSDVMRHAERLTAFAAGCAVTLAVAWTTGAVRAQGQADTTVHVCAAPDGVLRLVDLSAPCPVGQTSLYLALEQGPAGWADQPPPPPSTPSPSFGAWLNDLQQRVRNLENAAGTGKLGSKVVAPFIVTDRTGKTLFKVDQELVVLYNGAGKAVSIIKAGADGGYFAGVSGTSDLTASVGTSGSKGGVLVSEGGVNRIDLGKVVEGNFAARFYGKDGKNAVAAIGQTITGSGAAQVADAAGNIRAIMRLDDQQRGMIAVINRSSSTMVATLTEGLSGGGLLNIGSSSGERMVAAGVTDGFGVVQTGPASFMQAAGLGLPGSYIAGKR